MEILALIPARSGSKSVPHKNTRPIAGKPLMVHSIDHAKACSKISRIIVSTDSEDYAKIANEHGAETPFLRPDTISGDFATDLEAFKHTLDWLKEHEQYEPDLIIHLRPTHPVRDVFDIDNMIDLLINNPEADSVRSLTPAPETPYKMWRKAEGNTILPAAECGIAEAYNMPRQKLPDVFLHNGCIDVLKASTITKLNSMSGNCILGYEMDYGFDIDTEEQFRIAELALLVQADEQDPKRFCFDVDGVVATIVPGLNYADSKPNHKMIKIINHLYAKGHTITMFTARGTETGIDWREETEAQFKAWGLKYHRFLLGKPAADYYIDDRMVGLDMMHTIFG